jgi:hypothetical protein
MQQRCPFLAERSEPLQQFIFLRGLLGDLRRVDPLFDQGGPPARGLARLLQCGGADLAPGQELRAGEPRLEGVGPDPLVSDPKPGTRASMTCFRVPSGAGLIVLMRRSVRVFLGWRAMVLSFLYDQQIRTSGHHGGIILHEIERSGRSSHKKIKCKKCLASRDFRNST